MANAKRSQLRASNIKQKYQIKWNDKMERGRKDEECTNNRDMHIQMENEDE